MTSTAFRPGPRTMPLAVICSDIRARRLASPVRSKWCLSSPHRRRSLGKTVKYRLRMSPMAERCASWLFILLLTQPVRPRVLVTKRSHPLTYELELLAGRDLMHARRSEEHTSELQSL